MLLQEFLLLHKVGSTNSVDSIPNLGMNNDLC